MPTMQTIKVTIDNLLVTGDGDPSGKGEIYWYFSANSQTIDERTVNNPRKTASGENISIHQDTTVVVPSNNVLAIYCSVSDKDSGLDGADESAAATLSFTAANNWGAGTFKKTLTDKNLNVTVHGRIDLLQEEP